jgi:hypothetical protein
MNVFQQRTRARKGYTPDLDFLSGIISRNNLLPVPLSEAMFLGPCPVCGIGKNFMLWKNKGECHCYSCGLSGIFGPRIESRLNKD